MYLIVNDVKYSCTRRLSTKNTIKYLGVTPSPGAVSGVIQVYRDDGFLIAEDDTSKFMRHLFSESILTLTNLSPSNPAKILPTDTRVAALEEENALLKAQIQAQSDQMDFYEECMVEMAEIVYA